MISTVFGKSEPKRHGWHYLCTGLQAVGLMVSEKNFLSVSHFKSMQANDFQGMVILDIRSMDLSISA